MKAVITSPLRACSGRMYSHRAAQQVIYADQIKWLNMDDSVHCNLTGSQYRADLNEFDIAYVYHGNDWSGSANLFGGLEGFPFTFNFANFSKFKGEVRSIEIDFPDLYGQLRPRFDKFIEKKGYDALPTDWKRVDWDNLKSIQAKSKTVQMQQLHRHNRPLKEPKIAIGDSHAISCYRPGWQVNSVPFKTLYGALKMGFESFLPLTLAPWGEIDTYFGNIDLRHHLCRQQDPFGSAAELASRYVEECQKLHDRFGCKVRIWELLPCENESRKLPKTGYYEGTPYFGTWAQRMRVRAEFHAEIRKMIEGCSYLELFEWTQPLLNDKGELDFKHMEKPKSVHLSRAAYPLWQGAEWSGIDESEEETEKPNKSTKATTLEDFFL